MKYGPIAKIFHWSVAVLLAIQLPLGWLMPNIRRGMAPGAAMSLHIAVGITLLALIVMRFAWRLTQPVAPENTLPRWQRLGSELVHRLLYLTVWSATVSGWLFESYRGWDIDLFDMIPLPRLVAEGSGVGRDIGSWHAAIVWIVLILIAIHILAALTHLFIYKDRVMQRMLPG
jgi:cytochrome b561